MATTKETTSANTIIQLSFLNLEDDTSVVVQRLSEKYMTVLNKWHEKCGTIMDVDKIPEMLSIRQVLQKILLVRDDIS